MTIETWLATVHDELLDPRAHREELAELAEGLREAADEMGEEAACEAFGDPVEVARQLNVRAPITTHNGVRQLVGSPAGINPATIHRRLASTFDPADSRILVPHVLGVGWSVNLGAVAARMHLIEPDHLDEDVLNALDRRTLDFSAALVAIPALGTFLLLPFGLGQERLPNHWPLFGPPDGWVTPITGQWSSIAMTLIALAMAVVPRWTGTSQFWRLLLSLAATMLAVTACGVTAMQVFGGDRAIGWVVLPVMCVATLASMAQGVALVRLGARAAARTHNTTTHRS